MIPAGYRLLTVEDVGKVFDVDLEPIIYFDTSADMSGINTSETWIGGVIESPLRDQLTMVFNGVLVWDKRYASVPSPYWIYDTYTIPSGTEITSYFTSGASWNNTFLYIKEKAKEPTNPYLIKIKNKSGIILKTANKLCIENITLVLDESLFENNGNEEQSSFTLTLICDSNTLNNSGYTYSIDGGSTYSEFTATNIILENVTNIIFKESNAGLRRLWIGTSSGDNDIANLLGGEETVNIDSDKTLYVYAHYDAGGYD